jgi:hypothetical protein
VPDDETDDTDNESNNTVSYALPERTTYSAVGCSAIIPDVSEDNSDELHEQDSHESGSDNCDGGSDALDPSCGRFVL